MVDGPCSLLVFSALVFFLGMPVAFAFLTVNLICLYIWAGGLPAFALMGGSIFSTLNQFVLVPIPFFILMGDVLAISGVAWIIVDALDKWIGKVPGRLSLSAIVAGTVFAAVSGVSMGTTAMLGKVFYPEMRKREYDKLFSIGPIMGGEVLPSSFRRRPSASFWRPSRGCRWENS